MVAALAKGGWNRSEQLSSPGAGKSPALSDRPVGGRRRGVVARGCCVINTKRTGVDS